MTSEPVFVGGVPAMPFNHLSNVSSADALISPPLSPQAWAAHWEGAPVSLGVMASGSGSNFEAIAQAIDQQWLNAQIRVLVYNNPDAKAAARAERWGVPVVLLNHRDFDSREALDQAIVTTMQQHQVDWVMMAGWMRRVTQVLIDAFPQRMLNIHPSLLPSFPGIRAIEQALAARVAITGCTVHQVSLQVDSGPIVMQAAVPIWPDDTAETLHQRVQVQEHRLFPAAIALATGQAQSFSA